MKKYKAQWMGSTTVGDFDEPFELMLEATNPQDAYDEAYAYAMESNNGLETDAFALVEYEAGDESENVPYIVQLARLIVKLENTWESGEKMRLIKDARDRRLLTANEALNLAVEFIK